MRGTRVALALLSFGSASSESTSEAPDFNIANALLDHGIDVSTVPALSGIQSSLVGGGGACSIACSSLQHIFANKLLASNTSAYDAFTASYWSAQQAAVDPQCVFEPTVAKDVSILVLIARLTQCPFSVKSGGHAAFAGASSSEGGITVAFGKMKGIALAEDKKFVAIEPGNTWYDVYAALEPHGLAVIGGRVSAIGVGGLTLGGGISFFSNRYGWACDNVASFEVVTASGTIITASPNTHPSLYWALRGGGPNFGIVTKFNFETIPQGLMWGGTRLHLEPSFPSVLSAFHNLGVNAEKDVSAAQILSFAYAQGTRIAASELEYAKPVASAPIFAEYLAIPALQDNTAVRSLANLTLTINAVNPNGLRETYWVATFKLNEDFTAWAVDMYYEEVLGVADVAGLIPALTLQVITVPMLREFAKKGGNALGLREEDGPLLLLQSNMMWQDAQDDERVLATNKRVIDRAVAEGSTRELGMEYIYMNYASQFQAVMGSYGEESLAKLKRVARMYDPNGVFQRLQPGYFKLDGAPATWEG